MLYERKRCVAVRGCAFGSRAVLPSQLYEIPILINIPIVNSGSCHDRRSQREVTRHCWRLLLLQRIIKILRIA